ncbi:24146_t:CDS:1, partial [Gigaspora rosea]
KTNQYFVEDGLDQGSPLSPTLWRIYYDPLISRIDKEHNGYKMQTITPNGKLVECRMSVLAYMDDSLWIAEKREDLQKIIDMANNF